MSFASNLQRTLGEKGWTQKELRLKTGIGKSTIARYVSGETEPSWANAVRIAEALNVSLDSLAGRAKPSQALVDGLGRNYSLLDNYGRAKLLDFSKDLVASGRYACAKSAPSSPSGENTRVQAAQSA